MSEYGQFDQPTPPGWMPENLNPLTYPLPSESAPIWDLGSIPLGPAQYFQIDPDQALQVIATFRELAEKLRELQLQADQPLDVLAPGGDAVSRNAADELGGWALGTEPGSLRLALESGAIQMEQAANALARSLATHQNNDELSAEYLNRLNLCGRNADGHQL